MNYSDRLVNGVVAFALVSLLFMSLGIIHARLRVIIPDLLIVLIFVLEMWSKPINNQ